MTDKLQRVSEVPALEAVYQDPADLELGVITQELPVALTILAEKPLIIGDWKWAFHIIGESHFVRVERGGQLVLHEVLACLSLPVAACAHHHRFGDLRHHRYRQGPYCVAVSIEDRSSWESLPDSARPFLELEFPAIFGRVPVTRIHVEESSGSVRWRTLHVYPQQGEVTVVRTVSEFCCW